VLGKGPPSLALLNGMRPDLWPFPRHSLRESETPPRREVQCVPTRGVCRRDAAPALLIPLTLQISKDGSAKVGACPKQSAWGRETRPSVRPQSGPAARVALLWSGGRRGVGASG
jgi:hypothetical protein